MKSGEQKATAERVVKDIRRKTRRQHSAEEKIRIVLEGLVVKTMRPCPPLVRGQWLNAQRCRCEGIATSLYYSWSKEFLEAGKRRLGNMKQQPFISGDLIHAAIVSRVFSESSN